ncbi:hypothetical protein [Enterocloster sp.]|uniref:hypothetical protein n=1 Tax=Enterocloster sp. TaxID=2719315 RepID=UPI00399F0A05
MKQIIRKRLCIVILTAMLTTLLINYYIEIHNAQNEMYTSAQEMFWQVGQILDQNEKEAEKERENLKEQCFIRAKQSPTSCRTVPRLRETSRKWKR